MIWQWDVKVHQFKGLSNLTLLLLKHRQHDHRQPMPTRISSHIPSKIQNIYQISFPEIHHKHDLKSFKHSKKPQTYKM